MQADATPYGLLVQISVEMEQRLNVVVASRTLVPASDPPPGFPAVLTASNLDLIFGSFHISLITVYPSPPPAPGGGLPAVTAAVRAALPSFLSRFFPLAGRVVTTTGVPEIACNNAGAELVVADVDAALAADVDFADADRSLRAIALPFQRGLALSLQLLRFACGGFALVWGTDHLLVDGLGLMALPTAWAAHILGGGGGGLSSWEPYPDRASLFPPRSPPRYPPSLDAEFTRYAPGSLPTSLLVATLVRRVYVVSGADLDRLRAAATTPARRATRLKALSAHAWKLLAAAVAGDGGDTHCRVAWLVDGRRHLDRAKYDGAALRRYLGNVLTYASREAAVEAVASAPLADVAAMAGAAIAEALRPERYEELVDWMEAHKGVFRDGGGGGKWTEAVGTGVGSPALVISSVAPVRVEGDFGFGRPHLVMPWVRPGRLGSASMIVARSPAEDGAWVVSARLWPRLAQALEADPEAVFRPATAARLGFAGGVHQRQNEPAGLRSRF